MTAWPSRHRRTTPASAERLVRHREAAAALAALALTALLPLACGGDAPAPAPPVAPAAAEPSAAPGLGHPPVVEALDLKPESPTAGDEIELVVRASDPDGDRLTTEIAWYVNRELRRSGSRTRFETNDLLRGAEVYAIVRVSDGKQVTQRQTATRVIGNALPRVLELRIVPTPPRAAELTTAQATVSDADGDPVTVAYQWFADDQLIAGANAATLEPGHLRRGQHLVVRAAASDKSGQGAWTDSTDVVVGNSDPRIESQPALGLTNDRRYAYHLKATDPDGDHPLRYELVEGPPGMDVDLLSGVVTWVVPSDSASGVVPVEVAVSDGRGGEAHQRYELTIHWDEAPAAPRDAK